MYWKASIKHQRRQIYTQTYDNTASLFLSKTKKNKIVQGDVLCVLDLAQNYTTVYQDEIKSAHNGKQQITMHPIPFYYRNQQHTLIRASFVMLSDDITHDACVVAAFGERLFQHLQFKGMNVFHLIKWCDGAGSQYKRAQAFLHISEDAAIYKIKISRCFYGSEHGKGDSDGETGSTCTWHRSHH